MIAGEILKAVAVVSEDGVAGDDVQVRLDVTVGICCLLIRNCQHGLIGESCCDKGAGDFLVLTKKICHVTEKRLKSGYVGLSKALTCSAQVLIIFACCRVNTEEEGSVKLVPGLYGEIGTLRFQFIEGFQVWLGLLFWPEVDDIQNDTRLESDIVSKRPIMEGF